MSQLILRRRQEAAGAELTVKMWAFPYLTWATIVAIVAMVLGMVVIGETRESLLLSAGLAVVVVAIGAVRQRRGHHAPAEASPSGESTPALEPAKS